MLKRAVMMLPLLFACGGDGGADGGIVFQKPQILPDNAPICLNFERTVAGEERGHNALLRNNGREQLVIQSATITDDLRGSFEFVGVEPKAVDSPESAVARFFYKPSEPGWDTALLRVMSNAENFPDLRIFILGRAEPANLDGGVWDAGPKPATAGTGEDEACRVVDAGM